MTVTGDWEQVTLKGQRLPLPGGGSVEITDDTPAKLGDGFTYRVLTYRKGICEAVFEVTNGVPACVRLELVGTDIRTRDLAAINLDAIRPLIFQVAGIGIVTDSGEEYEIPVSGEPRRRKVTPDFLREVAKVHDDAPEGRRLAAVIGAFQVSERQALRYIGAAKKGRFIRGN